MGEAIVENNIFTGLGSEYHTWVDGLQEILGKRDITIRIRCIGLKEYEGTHKVPEFPRRLDLFRDTVVNTVDERALLLQLIFAGILES